MGTDIHMYSEKKINGKWVMNGNSFASPFNNGIVYETIYDDRNYNFFTVLCGIRRNIECKTIVDSDRGLPEDMSAYAKKFFNTDFFHDVGYATLTELLEYDWDSRTSVARICSLDVYNKYLSTGEMDLYCRSSSCYTIEEEEAKDILKNGIDNYKGETIYVRAITGLKLSEYVGDFHSHVLPKLCQLSINECDGESDDVRILFGFDS